MKISKITMTNTVKRVTEIIMIQLPIDNIKMTIMNDKNLVGIFCTALILICLSS